MIRGMWRAVCAAVLAGSAVHSIAADIEYATPAPPRILSTEISGRDLAFFMAAAPEMALLGKVAEVGAQRAVTPEVKAEAILLVKEEKDQVAKLKALADEMGPPLSLEPDATGAKTIKTLARLQGVKFDKSFLDDAADAEDQLRAALISGAASQTGAIKDFCNVELAALKQQRQRLNRLGL